MRPKRSTRGVALGLGGALTLLPAVAAADDAAVLITPGYLHGFHFGDGPTHSNGVEVTLNWYPDAEIASCA